MIKLIYKQTMKMDTFSGIYITVCILLFIELVLAVIFVVKWPKMVDSFRTLVIGFILLNIVSRIV